MTLDKWPNRDVCTLEPNLTWKVWRGPRFTVRPVVFEGTVGEIVERVGALRDEAPIRPHYLSGRCEAEACYHLNVESLEGERLRARLQLYVVAGPTEERAPIREHLRAAILDELAKPSEINLAY